MIIPRRSTAFRATLAASALLMWAHAESKLPTATTAKQLAHFLPPQWGLTKHTTGDLNQDGRADAVAVAAGPDEYNPDTPRYLLVAFATPTGSWRLAARTNTPILGSQEGGMIGDPLESIAIERGILVITHYGGSRDRWGCTDRFRYQDSEFFHIGHTVAQLDMLESTSHEVDTDFLTGQQLITSSKGGKPPKIVVGEVRVKPLGTMEAYKPCGE